MDAQWWSWTLTAVGLTGFVLAGRRVWWSWYINLGCQALWLAYALITGQYGFIVAALAYSIVFTRNAINWTREHRARERVCPQCGEPVHSLLESFAHCDPYEPIDDLNDDDTITRSTN